MEETLSLLGYLREQGRLREKLRREVVRGTDQNMFVLH